MGATPSTDSIIIEFGCQFRVEIKGVQFSDDPYGIQQVTAADVDRFYPEGTSWIW